MKSKPLIYKQLQDYLEDRTYEELLEASQIIQGILARHLYACGYYTKREDHE